MCDIYGHRDIDDVIYKELHKMNLKDVKKELLKINTNELWKSPSELLVKIVSVDRGAYQHFYNDLWYNLNNYNKNMALHDIYGQDHEDHGYCLNCVHYGLPCRNCCYCFPSLNRSELFQANFNIRNTDDEEYELFSYEEYENFEDESIDGPLEIRYWAGRD